MCESGKLVKNVRSGLGSSPTGDKVKEGDGKTPEGVFFVPRLIPDSAFYKGIHGSRSDKDWTRGDVALDDTSVDLLWSAIGVGDTVVVVP